RTSRGSTGTPTGTALHVPVPTRRAEAAAGRSCRRLERRGARTSRWLGVPRDVDRVKLCYRRCVGRFGAFCVAALAACSDGSQGAVSMRWRIVDLTTGVSYDPRSQAGPQGSCRCAPSGTPGGCDGSPGWEVDRVRLRIADPSGACTKPVDES